MVRAGYLAMQSITWLILVPLSLASLLSGVVQGLGTTWGLFRHYWVVAKLFITVLATVILLVHTQPIGHLARVVADTTLARGELAGLRVQLVADAGAALLALLAATTLSIYKPWGLTPYGGQLLRQGAGDEPSRLLLGRYVLLAMAGLVLLVMLLHLTRRG